MDNLFSPRFKFDEASNDEAKICVVGVGGGGGNAINNMVDRGIQGVDFIAINTDAQALGANLATTKIQVGRSVTKGLGAGARPSAGAEAVQENYEQIEQALSDYDMVFVTAGMGGGTGTGGAPVVASITRSLGILSVAIVTRPFECEGGRRMKTATEGIERLREYIDTLIVIPNERLLDIAEEDTSLVEAFARADEVLYNATRGISDLITVQGLINLDFADVKTTMQNGGTALMGAATAEGENRAERAAIEAISSPLLDGLSIKGARNVLVNITAGSSLGIKEATDATSIIQREAGDDVEVIFGTVIDEASDDELRVTVIATGFDGPPRQEKSFKPSALHTDMSVHHYKGEENLKQLDTPAYVRRSKSPILLDPETADVKDTARKPSVRRVAPNELRDITESIMKDDHETPAFIRKMMD